MRISNSLATIASTLEVQNQLLRKIADTLGDGESKSDDQSQTDS
jgi:hypothetical protein